MTKQECKAVMYLDIPWTKEMKQAWSRITNDDEFSGIDELEEAFEIGWRAAELAMRKRKTT